MCVVIDLPCFRWFLCLSVFLLILMLLRMLCSFFPSSYSTFQSKFALSSPRWTWNFNPMCRIVSVRIPTFFRISDLRWKKLRVPRNFSPTPPSVRNIGSTRSDCCDDNSIYLRQGVTRTHCSAAGGRGRLPRCSVLGEQIVYNADIVSSGKKL